MSTSRQRTIRSLVILPLAALLFGAAISVAVAWWPGLRGFDTSSPIGNPALQRQDGPGTFDSLAQHRGFQLFDHRRMVAPGPIPSFLIDEFSRGLHEHALKNPRPTAPHWAVVPAEFILAARPMTQLRVHIYGFGWPRVCLTGCAEVPIRKSFPHIQRRDFISIAETPTKRHLLPTRVHWPGLLFNTLAFGGPVLLGSVLPLAGLARRRARVRRGACPACGYDLRGGDTRTDGRPCPECGRARA